MNIPELKEKIKATSERLNTKEIYTVLLILVVGFGSFGLGRLSRLQESKSPIRIEYPSSAQSASAISAAPPFQEEDREVVKSPLIKGVPRSSEAGVVSSGGQIIASKGGTKYHFPWCSGAQRISEANKIWFNSVEEARKAGYTPASNCKGLK